MKQSPTFEIEKQAIKTHGPVVAGVDEAGRGPWAGPVVAAAVILDQNDYPDGLNDSKKLSEKKRDELYNQLQETAIIGIGIAHVSKIDELNILHASLWAMAKACSTLATEPNSLLIDGNKAPKISLPCETVVKGDAKSLSIAAASIIAKVTRDRMMSDLAKEYPYYAWEKNKGYGTKAHIEGLREHGITEYHRRSFKPIKVYL